MTETVITIADVAWFKTSAVRQWLRDNNKSHDWILQQARTECDNGAVWAHWRPGTAVTPRGSANIVVDASAAIAADFVPTE